MLRRAIRERRATVADFLGAPPGCRHSNRAVAMLVGKPAGQVDQHDLARAIKLLQSDSMLVGVSDRLVEASVMFAAAGGFEPREMISCSNPVGLSSMLSLLYVVSAGSHCAPYSNCSHSHDTQPALRINAPSGHDTASHTSPNT